MKNAFVILCLMALAGTAFPQSKKARKTETTVKTVKPYTPKIYTSFKINNRIDEYVIAKLEERKIKPAETASDEVFLRRVYLDVTGSIPTVAEVRKFLADTDVNRREKLIDRLLATDGYIDYMTMKWCDLLRVRSEFPINLWPNAAQAYHRWIRDSIASNKPYDDFARELLTSSGANFRDAPVNFYRAVPRKEPAVIAQAAALTFMGSRTDHWQPELVRSFSAMFAKIAYKGTLEWKEEIIFYDPDKPPLKGTNGVPVAPLLPDGTKVVFDAGIDPRVQFADWLITPENPWFTRAIVNRMWYWFLGRGIIHEPDDIRPENKPSNPELLAYLEQDIIAHDYDLKYMIRQILLSGTYQLASIPGESAYTNDICFANYHIRRIEAEVIIDAINAITGTTESYSSPIPEPFTYIPENQTSVRLYDGSINSSFLEMFGRPARDTGTETERNNNVTSAQELHMLNSTHIQDKLRRSTTMRRVLSQIRGTDKQIEELYLAILSRFPTADEKRIGEEYIKNIKNTTDGLGDVAWALINSTEFIVKH